MSDFGFTGGKFDSSWFKKVVDHWNNNLFKYKLVIGGYDEIVGVSYKVDLILFA